MPTDVTRNPGTPDPPSPNRFDMMVGEDANQPLVPAPTPPSITVPPGTPITLQPNVVLQPRGPALVLPSAPTPIPTENRSTRMQSMGIKISELKSQLKIVGWLWDIPSISAVTLEGNALALVGMGDAQILGYDADSPSTADDPEEQYACKILYVRGTQGITSVKFKQLRRWIDSLHPTTRLHATDGARIWPVVGVRFDRVSSYSSSSRYNMFLSLGPAL